MARVTAPASSAARPLRFVKVEGAGNDYVLVDVFDQRVDDPADLARRLSDRHRGVGSDGVLLVGPPSPGSGAVASMAIHNADGSRGLMCGNGLRCVVRYLVETRGATATRDRPLGVETASGVLRGAVVDAERVTIEMGEPRLDAALDAPAEGADPPRAVFVSTGNPHVVARVADPGAVDLAAWAGRLGAPREGLPQGANVHVVAWRDHALVVRPYELGSGATQACGTGAVASVAAARTHGWLDAAAPDADVVVRMPGGELGVRWSGRGVAWLTGPARLVFDGELRTC